MTGNHYRSTTIRKLWDRVRKKVGINDLRLYDATRHSVASQLLNSGTSIHSISKILGHSSLKMTERYAHQNPETIRLDLEKLSLLGAPMGHQLPIAPKK